MSSISLVISPQSVEYVGGRLDPDTDSRLNAYRLVHEQQGRAGLATDFADQRERRLRVRVIQISGWLVSQHEGRMIRQGTGERDALALPPDNCAG